MMSFFTFTLETTLLGYVFDLDSFTIRSPKEGWL